MQPNRKHQSKRRWSPMHYMLRLPPEFFRCFFGKNGIGKDGCWCLEFLSKKNMYIATLKPVSISYLDDWKRCVFILPYLSNPNPQIPKNLPFTFHPKCASHLLIWIGALISWATISTYCIHKRSTRTHGSKVGNHQCQQSQDDTDRSNDLGRGGLEPAYPIVKICSVNKPTEILYPNFF